MIPKGFALFLSCVWKFKINSESDMKFAAHSIHEFYV